MKVRDQSLSRIKSNIELMVATNGGNKAVVIPHSMGVIYFLHFMKWVEAPAPMGGGGGPDWCAKHIKGGDEYWWTRSEISRISTDADLPQPHSIVEDDEQDACWRR